MVAYISMAFGNPYDDPWNEEQLVDAAKKITEFGIASISLADTVGSADAESIKRVVAAVSGDCNRCEVGVHLHSTRSHAMEKILAAYDAGCRRFDSAMGGLGGCPFAQDDLVGNIPTEEVLRALEKRGMTLPITDVQSAMAMNAEIANEFSAR